MSVKVFIILVTVAAGAILLMATVIACKVLRAEEANLLLEGLDEVTQKALYIATKMVLAKRDTEEGTKKS